MESRENTEQEEDQRKGQIPGMMERVYGGKRYLGEQEEPAECCYAGIKNSFKQW